MPKPSSRSRSTTWKPPASEARAARRAAREAVSEPVRAPDEIEHDLVRAGPDAVETQVAPDSLDPVLAHVAGAAVDLDALVGDLDGDPRGVELGHRDLAHGVFAVRMTPGGRVDHLARGLDLRRHLRELVADDLEVADLAPEGAPLQRVAQRTVETVLGGSD